MIVGMMRIRNESRWIERVIAAQLPAVEQLFILDDNSDDNTVELCQQFSRVTLFRSPFTGTDECRDRNWQLTQLEKVVQTGDWILAIDGDEEIASGGCAEIRALADRDSGHDAYRFQVLYLWDAPDQIRVDGIYANF